MPEQVLEQLVADNADLADQVAQEFIERFEDMQDDLLARLIRSLKKFPIADGAFAKDASTNRLLGQVDRVVRGVMKNEDLRSAVRDLLPEFDRIGENAALMHGEESDIKVSRALLNETKQRMIDLTVRNVVDAHFDERFVVPVKKILYTHVNAGAEVDELEKALRSMIVDDQALASRAGVVARDALNQYEGAVHKEIALRYDLFNYRYIGNLLPSHKATKGKRKGQQIGGTRKQCRRWLAKEIITQEELPKEVAWMLRYGSGWIPGTTPAIWPIVRGGYNCMHTALPTRREP